MLGTQENNSYEHYTTYFGYDTAKPQLVNESIARNQTEADVARQWMERHAKNGVAADKLGGHTSIYFRTYKH